MDEVSPAVAKEIARLLTEAGWTVRRLRDEAGMGTTTARSLLGQGALLPSLANADKALALIRRELWHRKRARK